MSKPSEEDQISVDMGSAESKAIGDQETAMAGRKVALQTDVAVLESTTIQTKVRSETLDEVLSRRRDTLTSEDEFIEDGLRRMRSSSIEAALREHARLALERSADENHGRYEVRRGVHSPVVYVHDREDYTSRSDEHVQQVKGIKLLHPVANLEYRSSNGSVDVSHLLRDDVMSPEAKEAWPLNFVSVRCPELDEAEYWWQLTFMSKSIAELCETSESTYDTVTENGFVGQSEWMRVLDSTVDSVSLEPLSD